MQSSKLKRKEKELLTLPSLEVAFNSKSNAGKKYSPFCIFLADKTVLIIKKKRELALRPGLMWKTLKVYVLGFILVRTFPTFPTDTF